MSKTARSTGMRRMAESSTATNLELFFDLVFVFALTQVTAFMAEDPTWTGVGRGALMLAVVWWCWVGYSWLSNLVKADEGLARVAMLTAMAAMFGVAIAIPEAFEDLPGGLHGPTVFAFGYLVVRLVHLWLFWIVARGDHALRAQLVRFGATMAGGTILLLIAAQTSGTTQALLWVAAIVADYGGTVAIGVTGWRIESAKHFAERHGLILLIALGESIVAIGVGVNLLPISLPIIVAAALGLAVSACLWWAYFDTHATMSEHALAEAEGEDRARMGRTAFTYLHLPMVVGIVMLALGLKKVLNYVAGDGGHTLSDALYGPPLWAMFGGVSLFLLAMAGVSWRCHRNLKVQRIALGLALLAIVPLMALLPALASLGVLTAAMMGLIAYEWIKYHEHREQIRASA
ncbi:low temperature requirement protein A [Actinokineospora sp. HUAS TT18]|uniref:low temperature requirement protein A n=1 Tax=Actinokineospora sp. HUAS TT18 TaxID=3447451 RepID=UPI003F520E12